MSYDDEDDGHSPDLQLYSNLRESITKELHENQSPLLTHLNADTTWLLSLPYTKGTSNPQKRTYYHILIDPWLAGGQADVARFFSQQWHATRSAVTNLVEVDEVIWGIEQAAVGTYDMTLAEDQERRKAAGQDRQTWVDLVVVSHEFTDHMHKETLLEVDPEVPVFATAKAAGIIRSWKHFGTVRDVSRFAGDWRDASHEVLPDWVGISRVAYDGPDLLYYHSAIMITFARATSSKKGTGQQAEAVIYTPHGISPDNLATLIRADPPIQTLALLHGLQDIQINTAWTSSVKAQLNKGAHNGLKVQRLLNAKYWIGTHDEVKKGGGIVSWFLSRKIITLQEAIEEEQNSLGENEGLPVDLGAVRFEELGNGESLILV